MPLIRTEWAWGRWIAVGVARPLEEQTMNAEPIHVLLLEDNPADARLLMEMLSDAGRQEFRLTVAARVGEIHDVLARAGRPADVALVDLTLPDSAGLETVERVRAALPDVPIVVLTGTKDEAMGLEAVRSGVQDYLVKGDFERGTLARAIHYAIERQRVHQLTIAKDAAEAANRAKDLFLAMVSHDLRGPLSAIGLSAELLRREKIDESTTREVAGQIVQCVKVQSRLIEDLLDTCRLTQGTMHVRPEPMDLAEVVRSSVAMARPVAESQGVKLQADSLARRAPVLGDPARLRQVVSNLLSNALKFTPRGGHVKVMLDDTGSAARLRVIDDGRGIEPGLLGQVFERFWQADHPDSGARGGLGLGLAIARGIVDLHGGRLDAESAGPGRGATFTMELSLDDGRHRPRGSSRYAAERNSP
jgi:signal transduction histidine kinase